MTTFSGFDTINQPGVSPIIPPKQAKLNCWECLEAADLPTSAHAGHAVKWRKIEARGVIRLTCSRGHWWEIRTADIPVGPLPEPATDELAYMLKPKRERRRGPKNYTHTKLADWDVPLFPSTIRPIPTMAAELLAMLYY